MILFIFFALGCGEWDKYWAPDVPEPPPAPEPDFNPPLVSILTPSGADTLNPSPVGGDFEIHVEAEDDRQLAGVALFIDGEERTSFSIRPFTFRWNTTECDEGSLHPIWAQAKDASGNAATSDTVFAIVFNQGPEIHLTSPTDGELLRGQIELAAEPLDPRVPLQRVSFMVNGRVIGTVTSPPFVTVWNSEMERPGTFLIGAMGIGENGEVGISPAVAVEINNIPPRVTLTFPESGRVVAKLGTVPFGATARDTIHASIDDSLVWRSDLDGPLGSGPYLPTTGLSVGTHTIRVSATNAWGLSDEDEIQLVVNAEPTYSLCWDIYFADQFLLTKCYPCHTPWAPEYAQSELDMSSWRTILTGGRSFREFGLRAISPCKPESSLIYLKVTRPVPPVGDPMPPPGASSPLQPEQIEVLRVWIEEGAPPDEGYEDGC